MRAHVITFVVATLVLIAGSAGVVATSEDGAPDSSSRSVEQLEQLFERYNRRDIGLKTLYEKLDEWDRSELMSAAQPFLASEAKTLNKALAPDHLRSEVRPSLRKKLRNKRKRLLRIIRDRRRYTPENRSLKRRVTRASVGLLTLFRKPLVYHMQTSDTYSDAFFRTIALIRYLRSGDASLSKSIRNLLNRIGKAREIISTDTVGRSVELQPHSRENKDIVEANKKTEVDLSNPERSLVRSVNLYREAFGLRKLLVHREVTEAARKQSRRMKRHGQLTHQSNQASKQPLLDRLRSIGFRARKAGENVAKGDHTAMSILKGWIQSPAHHRNLLMEDYRYLGVAKKGRFWTLDMTTVPRIEPRGSSTK